MMRELLRIASTTLPVLVACATVTPQPLTPLELERLEARVAQSPADREGVMRLATAYQESGRTEEARSLLERAASERSGDLELALMLAAVREELGDFAGARALYESYIAEGPSRRTRALLQRRLLLLERREMRAEVQRLVREEQLLAASEPEAGTVAVYPFLYSGANAELQPLARALAELLSTDLSQTSRLRVLERARVQMLLDELELAASGAVDPTTAARTGRLLRAEHIVQGRLEGQGGGLELQAAVMEVQAARELGVVQEQEALQRLFEAERRLALGIFSALGIQLTQAEEARVGQTPTQNLEALLAFGRALEAEDQGDFALAAQYFQQAAGLDPAFDLAVQRAERATLLEQAEQVTVQALTTTALIEAVSLDATALDAFPMPDPSGRDAVLEALQREGLATQGTLRIILSRPN